MLESFFSLHVVNYVVFIKTDLFTNTQVMSLAISFKIMDFSSVFSYKLLIYINVLVYSPILLIHVPIGL